MKRLVFLVCLAGVAAARADYELKVAPQSYDDWTNGSSYVGGEAPGSGATVILPANMNAKVDDGSIAFVSTFARIKPMAKDTSVLTVDVTNEQSLGCAVYYAAWTGRADLNTRGKIVKRGVGTVTLAKTGASPFFTDIEVAEGALALAPRGGVTDHNYGRIAVAENALLISGGTKGEDTQNWMINLSGSGIVSNGVGLTTILPGYGDGAPVEFSGRILGAIAWYSHGCEYLTGTNSTFWGGFRVQSNAGTLTRGITGLAKIGRVNGGDVVDNSSMGQFDSILLVEFGGRILYLGDGEETDKNIQFASSGSDAVGHPGVIDAGAKGGVTFTGRFFPVGGKVERMHLTGSNVNECVFSGNASAYTENGVTHYFYVTKKGTGTWRFADGTTEVSSRSGIHGVGIEEGTFAIDSLAETGKVCSVGLGSWWTTDVRVKADGTIPRVPYQFNLGTAKTRGNLKYTGKGVRLLQNATRPMVLSGDGGLANAGNEKSDGSGRETRFFYRAGVSSIAEGTHMLTLYGDAVEESVVSNIFDGAVGQVGVAKEGSGTWKLEPGNTFTGPIDVREGKLVLLGQSGKFSWFRWTIRQTRNFDTNPAQPKNCQINVGEFGLYDASGNRVGANLQLPGSLTSSYNFNPDEYCKLCVGEVAFGKKLEDWDYTETASNTPDKMFNDIANKYNYLGMLQKKNVGGVRTSVVSVTNDPSTWVSFVMRLDPSENEVRSYDVACWATKAPSFPRSWILEGSVDGKTWYACHEIDAAPWPSSGSYNSQWSFSGGGNDNKTTSPASHHTGGQAICGHTNAVLVAYANPVSVAVGATIEAEGWVQLGALKLARSGNGTIRGFTLDTAGTLDFDGIPSGQESATIPVTFENVEGLENLSNWKVSVNGRSRPGYSLKYENGQLTVSRGGFVFVLR